MMPRILFGAVEQQNLSSPEGVSGLDPYRLDTIRWRWHAKRFDKRNGLGKSMVDVSQVGPHLPIEVRTPHRVVDALCPAPYSFIVVVAQSVFRVNHYMGSWEAYSYRNDARKGLHRSREGWEFRSRVSDAMDNVTHRWLRGFIEDVGLDKAIRLLNSTGLPRGYQKEVTGDWAFDRKRFAVDDYHFDMFLKTKHGNHSHPQSGGYSNNITETTQGNLSGGGLPKR